MCQNCRCGKAEHNVQDADDPGFYFVGKIFDRPLRTRQEEMEFCYGDVSDDSDDSEGSLGSGGGGGGPRKGALRSGSKDGRASSGKKKKTVRFEWVPPNISLALVSLPVAIDPPPL